MPPKQKRVTRKERLASRTIEDEIEDYMRKAGFSVTVSKYCFGSGSDDKSRREPDEEEVLFLNKEERVWPKIVEKERERMLNRTEEQLEADQKFTGKLNYHLCTSMTKLADRNLTCLKRKGYYFTAAPGVYVTVHWTEGQAFAKILEALDMVPSVLLQFLSQTKASGFRDFVRSFVQATEDVENNTLDDVTKDLCDLLKDYRAQFRVRRKKGGNDTVLIVGHGTAVVTPTDFSKFLARISRWIYQCEKVYDLCKLGQKAVQESISNRGKASVPSQDQWQKKMHDFKMTLKSELPVMVAKELDNLLLVFAEGSAYKVKFGHPCASITPKFYIQVEALCSSKERLIPDIPLNENGFCDEVTAKMSLAPGSKSVTLQDVLEQLQL